MRDSKINLTRILVALVLLVSGTSFYAIKGRAPAPNASSKPPASNRKAGKVPNRVGGDRSPAATATRDYSKLMTKHVNAMGQTVYELKEAYHDVSRPLSEMAKGFPAVTVSKDRENNEFPAPSWKGHQSAILDPVVDQGSSGLAVNPNPPVNGVTFRGPGLANGGLGGDPSDENASVGNGQVVITVNSAYGVYSTAGAVLLAPTATNALWAGFGGNCQTNNDGDPVVLYDKTANRWFIQQFVALNPGDICVAVSTTPNALGTYNRYVFTGFNANGLPDYPHFGVWPDGYYMQIHLFDPAPVGFVGGVFGALDRAKMLTGAAATMQFIIDPTEYGFMAADLDGHAPPPTNAPGIFASMSGQNIKLYRYKVDWAVPANTVRIVQATLPVAAYSDACSITASTSCIPQPGSTSGLESMHYHIMFRLAYRNLIDHETLLATHVVDPGIAGVTGGMRWYEIRLSGTPNAQCSSYPCIYQQGTVANLAGDLRSRWMGAIAMDGAGDIVLGYSTSGKANKTDNQSIRYTSRAPADALGTMPGPEQQIGPNGIGNEPLLGAAPGRGRWGDYNSMSVDNTDDCTFWYCNMTIDTTGNAGFSWNSRVGSTRFPAGTGPGQCPATGCATRPATAPTIGAATTPGLNQINVSWSAIAPAPGSYAIERALGTCAAPTTYYAPLAFVSGATTSYTDTTVQGGVRYNYRVVAATDANGKCQGLVFSGCVEAVATGTCNLKPAFNGATSASSANTSSCAVNVNWTSATTGCPLSSTMRYNVFRDTVPDFSTAPAGVTLAKRIAVCVPDPTPYKDGTAASGVTYYYVVRAEDNTTGNGGECGGGNEELNSTIVPGTAYGVGTNPVTSTWTDNGGDGTSFMLFNPPSRAAPPETYNTNTPGQDWRYISTATDAGANSTAGGRFAYRTAGPLASSIYADKVCTELRGPVLIAGAGNVALSYKERHNQEYQWDGIFVEYSVNGGAWIQAPNPAPVTDWGPLTQTLNPPINRCGYPATGPAGYTGPGPTNPATSTAYLLRTHTIPGLVDGQTLQFRWRNSSDDAASFTGFYLDDIAATNIHNPNACVPCGASSAPTMGTQLIGKAAPNLNFSWPAATGTSPFTYTTYSAPSMPPTWTSRNSTATLAWSNTVDLGAAGSFFYTTTAGNCFGASSK